MKGISFLQTWLIPIVPVIELGSNNKAQRAWTNEMIKDICIPIKVDRLGHIIEVKYRIDE